MKQLSIKLKITLWFTLFMILISAIIFAFVALLSRSATSHETKRTLVNLVEHNLGEIDYDDGWPEIDDDFISFHNGIYCLTYYETGERIGGYSPYASLEQEPLQDRELRTVSTVDGGNYYLYDRLLDFSRHSDIWVRGVVSEQAVTFNRSTVTGIGLVALPLLIVLAAVGGYLLARRLLRPIQQISRTAEAIGSGGDLSKRIDMEGSGDELHELAGTFNRMFTRLEENFQAQRRFTADASHELRTPVTTILAQCEYALENASGEGDLYEALGVIQRQGYRMSRLISSLLQFTRIDQRTESFVPQALHFSRLVENVCQEQKELTQNDIALTYRIQSDIFIKGDAMLLSRMLENMIRNAYRYGKTNGHILVTLRQIQQEAVLKVADDGIGIAPEELSKIWDRFYRVDKVRQTSREQSLGLGLSMVKEIVQMHDGKVHVDSVFGSGSEFMVKFTAIEMNSLPKSTDKEDGFG